MWTNCIPKKCLLSFSQHLLHNISSHLLFTSYSTSRSAKMLTTVKCAHHETHTKASPENGIKTALSQLWRRLTETLNFRTNALFSTAFPCWWKAAVLWISTASVSFDMKTRAEPLLTDFLKMEEKLCMLETSRNNELDVVGERYDRALPFRDLYPTFKGLPLEMWTFLSLLWIPNCLSLLINQIPSIPKWLVIKFLHSYFEIMPKCCPSNLEKECLKSIG